LFSVYSIAQTLNKSKQLHDEKRLIFQQKSGFYPTDFSSFLVAIVWISGINVKLTLGVGVGVGVGVGAGEDPIRRSPRSFRTVR
jgi:hypothetical protein